MPGFENASWFRGGGHEAFFCLAARDCSSLD